MNKHLAASLISCTFLTSCATSMTSGKLVTSSYDSDLSNKVVRTEVIYNEWGIESKSSFIDFDKSRGPFLLDRKNWTDNAKRYRWANTFVKTGAAKYAGYILASFSLISDNVPVLHKGDIVDVLYQKDQYGYDLDKLKANVVVKLVCQFDDTPCMNEVKKSNKWGVSSGYEVQYSKEFLERLTFTPVR